MYHLRVVLGIIVKIFQLNSASYSNDDGYAYQMMGVYEGNVGQIATIWVGYYDNYGTQWLDSIRIQINE